MTQRSLGAFMILDHIAIAREAGLPYVYLGYWVPASTRCTTRRPSAPSKCSSRGRWRRVRDAAEGAAIAPRGPRPFDPL
jgi:arginyl-tRNA--protein-N-Asp/Glu arginylyltransferase